MSMANYRGEEILTTRRSEEQKEELKVRWKKEVEKLKEKGVDNEMNIDVWMKEEEMAACCPHLLNKEKGQETLSPYQSAEGDSHSSHKDDEEERSHLKSDLQNLIKRAESIMHRISQNRSSHLEEALENVAHLLSTYADFKQLSDYFLVCGAFDVALQLLSSPCSSIKEFARNIIEGAAFQSTKSRDYIVSRFSEEGQTPDNEAINTLLDVFAFDSSYYSHGNELDSLPLVPAEILWSFLKTYIKAKSLLDNKSSTRQLGSSVNEEFRQFSSLFQLVSELLYVMGCSDLDSDTCCCKKRDSFRSDDDYKQHVSSVIVPGLVVRARKPHGKVKEGDLGEYTAKDSSSSNIDMMGKFTWYEPVAEVVSVPLNLVEILPKCQQRKKTVSSVHVTATHHDVYVTRPQWWEVLCVLQALPLHHIDSVISIINKTTVKTFDDLITLHPSYNEVASVIFHLKPFVPCHLLNSLTINRETSFKSFLLSRKNEVTGSVTVIKQAPPYPEPFSLSPPPVDVTVNSAHSPISAPAVIDHRHHLNNCRFTEKVEEIKAVVENHPGDCKVAVESLRALQGVIEGLATHGDRLNCCVSGMLGLILKLMAQEPKSSLLQSLGLECFFSLTGPVDDTLAVEMRQPVLPLSISSTITATIVSLASGEVSLNQLVDGIRCVAEYYNLQMSDKEKKDAVSSVHHGVCLLAASLDCCDHDDFLLHYNQWGVASLIGCVRHCGLVFPVEDDVYSLLSESLSSFPSLQSLKDAETESIALSAIKALQRQTFINFPLLSLLKLIGAKGVDFAKPPARVTSLFVQHCGIAYLSRAMVSNTDYLKSFRESCLLLLGCLVTDGQETCSHVIVQGGLGAVVTVLSKTCHHKEISALCLKILHLLSGYKDIRVNLSMHISRYFIKALSMHISEKEGKISLRQIQNSICGDHRFNIRFDTTRKRKTIATLLTGALTLVCEKVEEARRNHTQSPCVPLLNILLRTLTEKCERDRKGYHTILASSGMASIHDLSNDSPTSYWTSTSGYSPHWISIKLEEGVVIKKLSVQVRDQVYPFSLSQIPKSFEVLGEMAANFSVKLNTVKVPNQTTGYIELLGQQNIHYQTITLVIDNCHGGKYTDTKIACLKCETEWGTYGGVLSMFKGLFAERTRLFYHIQMQTWASDPSLDLLDLFDRFSSVIAYEDHFATKHFVSERDRLLQICKGPMYNILTTLLSRKDLPDLLRQYLSNVQPSSLLTLSLSKCIKRFELTGHNLLCSRTEPGVAIAILKSRIRRMCKVLIECNIPFSGKDLPSSGSTWPILSGIWKKIVCTEVTSFLHLCDFASHPITVMADFVIMYDRLRQTTTEIFNSQPPLLLAVKDGFSQALMKADQATVIRLCSVLCRSIDALLTRELMGGRVTESDKETILLKLAESLQFLHYLDFSQAFEYYYRKLLCNRVLGNGSASCLSLETKMAQSLYNYFPDRYPLLMLDDLNRSQVLNEQYRKSYLLKCLDDSLQQWPCQREVSWCPEVVDSADRILLSDLVLFYVSVLTPCNWPLPSRPLPPQAMTSLPIAAFITDYNKFFESEFKSSTHRPRLLNWTLYGDANLICNKTGCELNVTTAQMILLLAFNDREELEFQQLLEATHLSAEEVSNALHQLTDDGHPILSCFGNDVNSTFFKQGCTFKINDLFLSSSEMIKFSSSKPVPEKTNVIADLARVLERRKTIIEGALVRIMKKEKEMTVDSIATKVIEGCSLGLFDGGSSFRRFDCSYRDVCSRIKRLIANGYIKRNPTHPQILKYVPDPAEETVLQEENSDTGTKDIASSIFITRKRPGYRSLNVMKPKRTKYQRVSMDTEEREDDVPSIIVPQGTRSLSLDEVERIITSEVSLVSSILTVSNDAAESILYNCAWNKDKVIKEYFEDSESLLERCGLSLTLVTPSNLPSTCPICFDDNVEQDCVWLWCGHACCKMCWSVYLEVEIKFQPLSFTCPVVSGCLARPTRSFITEVAPGEIANFNRAIKDSFVEQCTGLTWCRNPSRCDQVLYCEDEMDAGVCTECSWSSCFSCTFIEAHHPASCDQMGKWIEAGGFYEGMGVDAKSRYLASIISKRCPECDVQIEKTEGCLQMTCKCGHIFCWRCLKQWDHKHYDCKGDVADSVMNTQKWKEHNEKCTSYSRSRVSAEKTAQVLVSSGHLQPLTYHACKLLVKCYKTLSYCSISEYYNDSPGYLPVLRDNLDSVATKLQGFVDSVSSSCSTCDVCSECEVKNYHRLMNMLESTIEKILVGSEQCFRVSGLNGTENSITIAPNTTVLNSNRMTYDDESEMDEENEFDDSSENYEGSSYDEFFYTDEEDGEYFDEDGMYY